MKAVSWIAMGLALVGSLIAAGAYWRVRSAAPPSPPAASGDAEPLKVRIARLEGELKDARDRVARLERDPKAGAGMGQEHVESGPASGEIADLKRRIELLERQALAGRSAPGPQGRTIPANPAMVEKEKKQLADASLPERTRATSLSRLRMYGAHKTDDVVESALALVNQSQETNIRTLVLRNLQGAENPKLAAPLVALLKGDANEDVRDEAARVLGDYLEQPDVKAALEQAAAQDSSEKVKRRAQSVLTALPKPR
ncbi:MAG TPA: HEAT repeat domain-containing protein [Planctomycetota bacterium]|nr:HEAT repeat domain-containing protein [Planctomycetota bacterium]